MLYRFRQWCWWCGFDGKPKKVENNGCNDDDPATACKTEAAQSDKHTATN